MVCMPYKQKGFTLLETVIALGLGLVVVALSVTTILYNSDSRQAEQVIAQLQMAKAGVLRYNLNDSKSTDKLVDLVRPGQNPDNWNGPYVDTATPITGDNFDISNIYPDSHLELATETVSDVRYQAVLLKGLADSKLRSVILDKCSGGCKPFPGRDDIGLLIQQVAVVAPYGGNGFDTPTIPGTPAPPPTAPPPWKPPTVNPPPTVPPVFPPPPINPPPPPNPCAVVACTGGPTDPGPPIPPPPSNCPDGSIKPINGICSIKPPADPPEKPKCLEGYTYYAGHCIWIAPPPDDPAPSPVRGCGPNYPPQEIESIQERDEYETRGMYDWVRTGRICRERIHSRPYSCSDANCFCNMDITKTFLGCS